MDVLGSTIQWTEQERTSWKACRRSYPLNITTFTIPFANLPNYFNPLILYIIIIIKGNERLPLISKRKRVWSLKLSWACNVWDYFIIIVSSTCNSCSCVGCGLCRSISIKLYRLIITNPTYLIKRIKPLNPNPSNFVLCSCLVRRLYKKLLTLIVTCQVWVVSRHEYKII